MDMSTRLILSAILLIALLISWFLLKITRKRHMEDPVFIEEQKKREDAYRQKIEQENKNLLEYEFSDEEYSDEIDEALNVTR